MPARVIIEMCGPVLRVLALKPKCPGCGKVIDSLPYVSKPRHTMGSEEKSHLRNRSDYEERSKFLITSHYCLACAVRLHIILEEDLPERGQYLEFLKKEFV